MSPTVPGCRSGGASYSFAQLGGTTLFVNNDAPLTSLQLVATYANQTGQNLSAPFTVTITKSYKATATAASQHTGGTNYNISLTGSATGGTAPYTFRWDIDNDGVYGDLIGANTSFVITSQGGTKRIGLEVTDAAGAPAFARTSLTVDKPPVANEPPRIRPAPDLPNGALRSATGAHFNFNSSRTPNGLLVATHGMYSTTLDLYSSTGWLRDFAERVELRMQRDRPGNLPNIATYDWSETSDPGGDINPALRAALDELAQHSVQIALGNAPRESPLLWRLAWRWARFARRCFIHTN